LDLINYCGDIIEEFSILTYGYFLKSLINIGFKHHTNR